MVDGPSDISVQPQKAQQIKPAESTKATPAKAEDKNGSAAIYSEDSMPVTTPPIDPKSIPQAKAGGENKGILDTLQESLKNPVDRSAYLSLVEQQFNSAIDQIAEPRDPKRPDLGSIQNDKAKSAVDKAIGMYAKAQKNEKLGSDSIKIGKDGTLEIEGPREDRIRKKLENQLSKIGNGSKETVSMGLTETEVKEALGKFDEYVQTSRDTDVQHLKWETQRRTMDLMRGGPGRFKEMSRDLKTLEAADTHLNGGKLSPDTKKFIDQANEYLKASTGKDPVTGQKTEKGKDPEAAAKIALDIFKPLVQQAKTYNQYDKALSMDGMLRDSLQHSLPGRNSDKEIDGWLAGNGYDVLRDDLVKGREVQSQMDKIVTAYLDSKPAEAAKLLDQFPEAKAAFLNTFETAGIYMSDEEKANILSSEPFKTLAKPYERLMDENKFQLEQSQHGFMQNAVRAVTRSVPRMFEGFKAIFTPGDGISTREAVSAITGGASSLMRSPTLLAGAAGTEVIQGTIGKIWKASSKTVAGKDAIDEKFANFNKHAEIAATLFNPVPMSGIVTGADTLLNLRERFETVRTGITHKDGKYIAFGGLLNLAGQ